MHDTHGVLGDVLKILDVRADCIATVEMSYSYYTFETFYTTF